MTTAALIVAAGRGERAGGGKPKQWRMVAGRRVIDWTISRFEEAASIDMIALVLASADAAERAGFESRGLIVATGGADRAGSVRNGLDALQGRGVTRVLIHDAARPCIRLADLE